MKSTGRSLRSTALIGVALAFVWLLEACGGGTSTGTSPSPSPSPSPIAKTATATVKGTSKTVLVNSQGFTLYYLTRDTPTKITCAGQCATTWPPLVLPSGTPTSSVVGNWSVLDRTDPVGRQVLFNGHPLYTYGPDTAPGDAKGEGVGGVWFVATPELKAPTASS